MKRKRESRIVARHLRNNCTEAELRFWHFVQNKQYKGFRFLRQHPVHIVDHGKPRYFIADFYCKKLKLIIELDGAVHDEQKERDDARTFLLNLKGFRVARLRNIDVTTEQSIFRFLDAAIQ